MLLLLLQNIFKMGMEMEAVWGCSQVSILQQFGNITTYAKNSFGCCLIIHTTVSWTSSWDVCLRTFFGNPKVWKLHGHKSRLYAWCLSIHLVLHSVGHMGMCIVQQDDAISEISHIVQGQLNAVKWKVIQTRLITIQFSHFGTTSLYIHAAQLCAGSCGSVV